MATQQEVEGANNASAFDPLTVGATEEFGAQDSLCSGDRFPRLGQTCVE